MTVNHAFMDRYRNLIFLLLICIFALGAYWNSLIVPFQFNDYVNFIQHPVNHDLTHYAKLDTWLHISNRPLSYYTLALNYHFNGTETRWYHIINLIIHILTGLLVFFLTLQLTRFFIKDDKNTNQWFAFLTALIFILHPLQTQAVTYITQRASLMGTFFYLLSVYFYGIGRFRHLDLGFSNKTLLLYECSALAFILALASKENAVTIPIALLLYEICFIRNKQNKIFKTYIAVFSAMLLLLVSIVIITKNVPYQTHLITRGQYFLTQLQVLVRYLEMMIVPVGLNIDHDVRINKHFFSLSVIISTFILLMVLETCIYLFKKRRIVSFAILWFFISLIVESSIVPIHDVMVEHRLYLPMFGFAIIVVYTSWYLLSRFKRGLYQIAIILIAIVYCGLSIQRNHVWSSEESIWTDAVQKSSAKARPHRMLADILFDKERYGEAIDEYKRALQIDDSTPEVYLNYGFAQEKQGNLAEAKKIYLHSLTIEPDQPIIYNRLGDVSQKEREFIMAKGYYRKALQLQPNFQEAMLGLAAAYDNIGEHRLADDLYKQAAEREEASYMAMVKLGMSLIEQGKYHNAIPNFMKAIEIDPYKAEAYYQLGRAFFSSHKLKDAQDNWEKALGANPDYYLAYNDLGTAAYMTQQFKLSIDYWEKSLKIEPNQANIYAMIGSSYFQMGDKAKLKEYYKKAADLGYTPAKNAIKNGKTGI